MKQKVFFSLFFVFVFANLSWAQGILSFTKENHDFGSVEEGTQATYEFEFTNTGKAPVVISGVSASCGCTTPYWTKEPILPGKKGKVTASYNSAGRPGVFNKSVTVVSNAEPSTKILTIKGVVNPKAEKAPTPEELAQSPVIQLTKESHSFGKIERGQTVTQTFTIANNGKSNLMVEKVHSPCNCVTFKSEQAAIAPGQKGTIELRYTPRMVTQEDEVISVFTNDLKNPMSKITLKADVVESLSSQNMLKEQKSVVPFK